MIIPSHTQIYFFLCALAGGLIVGLMIDGYRSVRYWSKPKRLMAAISDMLFWILCAIIIFIFYLYTNNGDFRYYTIIGMGLGILVYFKLLSRWLLKVMRWFIYYMGKAIRLTWSILIFPAKAIIYVVRFIRSITQSFLHKHKIKLKSKKQAPSSKKVNQKAGKSKAIKNIKINKNKKSPNKRDTKE